MRLISAITGSPSKYFSSISNSGCLPGFFDQGVAADVALVLQHVEDAAAQLGGRACDTFERLRMAAFLMRAIMSLRGSLKDIVYPSPTSST